MSLIDEALKRARHEAARQDAARNEANRREGPTPWVPLYERDRRRPSSRRPLVAGLLAGVLVAGLGIAGGLLWTRRDAPPAAAAPVHSAQRPVAPVPDDTGNPASAEALPPVTVEEVAPSALTAAAPPPPASRRPSSEPVGATHASPLPPAAREPLRAAEPPSPAPAPREAPARPAPAPPTRVDPPAQSPRRPHGSEATLPGGGKLALTGIAWSDTQPVALINGRVVGPGEIVEGYTVVGIEPHRVELRGDEGTVFLNLR